MTQKKIKYQLPNELGIIEFSSTVLTHFEKHKQHKYSDHEAGGQLFAVECRADFSTGVIDITGPRPTDKRGPQEYVPDRTAEKEEISERYKQGMHFIGDWHTHREYNPKPSPRDQNSMRELVSSSVHDLAGFLMVIVGLAEFPHGIHVSFHTKKNSTVLKPILDEPSSE